MIVGSDIKEGSIEVTVWRCQHYEICARDERRTPCHECKEVKLGIVSYYHRNPLKRGWWKFKKQLGDRWQQFWLTSGEQQSPLR